MDKSTRIFLFDLKLTRDYSFQVVIVIAVLRLHVIIMLSISVGGDGNGDTIGTEMEIRGRRPRIKGSRVRVPVIPDHFISTCSPVSLTGLSNAEWCVLCLGSMRLKDPLSKLR
jgi:hypothetical protein